MWPKWRDFSYLFCFLPLARFHCRPASDITRPLSAYQITCRHFESALKLKSAYLMLEKKRKINKKKKKEKKSGEKQAKQYFPNFRARTRPKKRQNEKNPRAAEPKENCQRQQQEKTPRGVGGKARGWVFSLGMEMEMKMAMEMVHFLAAVSDCVWLLFAVDFRCFRLLCCTSFWPSFFLFPLLLPQTKRPKVI